MIWKTGLVSTTFILSVAGSAAAQDVKTEDLTFPLVTASGAETTVDCTKLEEDHSIGLEFLRALDRGFHTSEPNYQPAFSEFALRGHLRVEGIQDAHFQFILDECKRRLGSPA